jgi:hypothetical protein
LLPSPSLAPLHCSPLHNNAAVAFFGSIALQSVAQQRCRRLLSLRCAVLLQAPLQAPLLQVRSRSTSLELWYGVRGGEGLVGGR